jgi:peptidoglycan/xylan/chitin deacetylase (PgdA/CDA1 family)
LLLLTNAAPHNQPTKRDFQNVYNCNVQGQAALTFDDGPFNYDQQISGELNGGKATFFFNGNNYGCIYDYADDMWVL